MQTDLLSRKFLLSLLAILSTVGLCAFKVISPDIYSTVTLGVVGMYVTGNVWQKVGTK